MDFSLFVLPTICIALAFILTKGNAKYLLAGYNTLSATDREKVVLDGYLHLFKRFHLFLGLSLLIVTLLLSRISPNFTDIVQVLSMIGGYSFFVYKSVWYFNPSRMQYGFSAAVSGMLALIAVVVLYFSVISFKESELKIDGDQLEITGIYGVTIDRENLTEVRILDQMPHIRSRTNGFNGGVYRKGNFRLDDGSKVKLFVNTTAKSFLLLKTTRGSIYFSSKEADLNAEYKRVSAWVGVGNT